MLGTDYDWPTGLCPTINRWPASQIDSTDPESRFLFEVLRFYWETNFILANLKDSAGSGHLPATASRLEAHLRSKAGLDRNLRRWGTYAEPELQGGKIINIQYTSPRGNWNNVTGIYSPQEDDTHSG